MNTLFRPIELKDFDQFRDMVSKIGPGMGASLKIGEEGLKKKYKNLLKALLRKL